MRCHKQWETFYHFVREISLQNRVWLVVDRSVELVLLLQKHENELSEL